MRRPSRVTRSRGHFTAAHARQRERNVSAEPAGPRWETRRPDVGLLLRRPGAVRVPGSGRRDSRVWGTRLGNSALGSSGFPQRVDTEGDRFAGAVNGSSLTRVPPHRRARARRARAVSVRSSASRMRWPWGHQAPSNARARYPSVCEVASVGYQTRYRVSPSPGGIGICHAGAVTGREGAAG